MKGMSRAGYLPAQFETKAVNGVVSNVRGCSKVIRVLSEHSHTLVSEDSENAVASKMRMDRHEIVMENVDPMFILKHGRLFPYRITRNFATDFSDGDPVCP